MHPIRFALPLLLLLLLTSSARAGDKMVEMEVVLSYTDTSDLDDRQTAETQSEIRDETQKRIERRLDAARVKHSEVSARGQSAIPGKLKPSRPLRWYKALITSPGKLEIREIRDGAIAWTALTSILGDDVEIRSEAESASNTYLWSPSREPLAKVARRVHLPGISVVVAPGQEAGWRSYAVAETLATNEDLKEVQRQISPVGAPYVTLVLSGSIADRLAAAGPSNVQRWGVILDGEVLGLVQASALRTHRVELTAPGRVATRDAERAWASQVQGRLAATLPLPIAVLEE